MMDLLLRVPRSAKGGLTLQDHSSMSISFSLSVLHSHFLMDPSHSAIGMEHECLSCLPSNPLSVHGSS